MHALTRPDLNALTFVNGAWHEGRVNVAGPHSHAFWLGSTVFDGARWFDGVAPDLDRHAARVNDSARTIGLKPLHTAEEIIALAWEGLRRFSGKVPVYVRPGYWAEEGDAGTVCPDPESTRFYLSLAEMPMGEPNGTSLSVSTFRRPTVETMPTDAKAGCLYPNNARAIREARSRGFDNALVLDMLGNVAETATSNIFMVRDGCAYTPVPNRSFLAGITRARVIELLRGDGITVIEASLQVADFLAADEVFTTGNHSKVLPVAKLESRTFGYGPVAQKARARYWEWAHSQRRDVRRG